MEQGNRQRRGQGLELLRDGFAADRLEHFPHPLEEVAQWKKFQRAAMLKVLDNAGADVVDEREIMPLRRLRGTPQRVTQPRGIVVDHLIAADLQRGAVADEGNHEERISFGGAGVELVLEEAALHGIAGGATGKGLDFLDELVHVLELPVNGDVADVGDRVDLV